MDERNQQNPHDGMSEDEKAFAEFLAQTEQQKAQPPADSQQEEEEVEQEEQAPEGQAQPPAQEPPKQQEPEDWTAGIADEALRERVRQEIAQREENARKAAEAARKFEAQWKAQAGQLAPVQRKLAELERAQKQKPAENPGGMNDAEWERYKREWPEESRVLEARLNPLAEQLRQMNEKLAAIEQEREASRAIESVRAEHEDYDEIDNSPEFAAWVDAMQTHPIFGPILAQGRLSPQQGSALIHEFKRDQAIAHFSQQKQEAPPAPSARATAVLGKREQQKRDIPIGNGGQSARSRSNAPVDPEEAEFAAFLAQNPP